MKLPAEAQMKTIPPDLRTAYYKAIAPFREQSAGLADTITDAGELRAARRHLADAARAAALPALVKAGGSDRQIADLLGWSRGAVERERRRRGLRGPGEPAPTTKTSTTASSEAARVADWARIGVLEARAVAQERERVALARALGESEARRAAAGVAVLGMLRFVALAELDARGPLSASALWAPLVPRSGPGSGWLGELAARALASLEEEGRIVRLGSRAGRFGVWALR